MLFSSQVFLYLFLPITLGVYHLFFWPAQRTGRPVLFVLSNLILLVASLVFYAWGEEFFVLVMLASIAANWLLGLWIDRTRGRPACRYALAAGVAVNLALLGAYKYANFFVDNLNVLLGGLGLGHVELAPVHLPLGISFFTFQAMSYVIDVYRRDAAVQRNPFNVALYIALFPQLVAGPIVRYRHVASQIVRRFVTTDDFAIGARRFIIGLGKKVLIANTAGAGADKIFAIPPHQLTTGLGWLGIICFAVQAYFDFSGYSDMAIGLGRMFGFTFLENFQWPYISRSIREFWRRWHISLSTWLRDYLYIPLGGNRRGPVRTYANLVTVFVLCGLWHGAAWTFVIFGLYHGVFLVAERAGLEKMIARLWRPFQHAYCLLVLMVGFVIFRADTLGQAGAFVAAMAGFAPGTGIEYHVKLYMDAELMRMLGIGIVFSVPWIPWLEAWHASRIAGRPGRFARFLDASLAYGSVAAPAIILLASAMWLAAGTYNPFIYFRF